MAGKINIRKIDAEGKEIPGCNLHALWGKEVSLSESEFTITIEPLGGLVTRAA